MPKKIGTSGTAEKETEKVVEVTKPTTQATTTTKKPVEERLKKLLTTLAKGTKDGEVFDETELTISEISSMKQKDGGEIAVVVFETTEMAKEAILRGNCALDEFLKDRRENSQITGVVDGDDFCLMYEEI